MWTGGNEKVGGGVDMTKSNKNKSENPEKMPDGSSFDAIFSPGSDDPYHMIGMALVNRFGYGNYIYLEGFHEAAETLFDSLGDSHSANIIVYPLIFRHFHKIVEKILIDFSKEFANSRQIP